MSYASGSPTTVCVSGCVSFPAFFLFAFQPVTPFPPSTIRRHTVAQQCPQPMLSLLQDRKRGPGCPSPSDNQSSEYPSPPSDRPLVTRHRPGRPVPYDVPYPVVEQYAYPVEASGSRNYLRFLGSSPSYSDYWLTPDPHWGWTMERGSGNPPGTSGLGGSAATDGWLSLPRAMSSKNDLGRLSPEGSKPPYANLRQRSFAPSRPPSPLRKSSTWSAPSRNSCHSGPNENAWTPKVPKRWLHLVLFPIFFSSMTTQTIASGFPP